ncbi:thioesterase II family protein [Gorillibacterium sp. sgz500922]|uniref:thioesterase II family protein n=1 Tax=Gorillibacterium sp. sgz500922 TaxID=3446694 RepID=UPI003F680C56
MKKHKLYCFPYAGASPICYYGWNKYLDRSIEMVQVELAGRGRRQTEPFCQTAQEAVEDLYNRLSDQWNDEPFSFFGHSMGSLLAFELSRLLQNRKGLEPAHLFVSGRWAPHIHREQPDYYNLSDHELKEKIIGLGGTPEELFQSETLTKVFIPILRADFDMMHHYTFEEREPLSSPLWVMTGSGDIEVNQRDLVEWSRHTTGEFAMIKFKGGHFYIKESEESLVERINRTILHY